MTKWCRRIACWEIKVTGTHSESVKIIAFPPQQCDVNVPQCYVIRMYIACLVYLYYHIMCDSGKTPAGLKVCHPLCVRSVIQSCSVYIPIYTLQP